MKDLVIDLEIAKQLKEAGWAGETKFYYTLENELLYQGNIEESYEIYIAPPNMLYSAPLAEEILQELPGSIEYDYNGYCGVIPWLQINKMNNIYCISYLLKIGDDDYSQPFSISNDKLSNALAMLWFELKQKNLL